MSIDIEKKEREFLRDLDGKLGEKEMPFAKYFKNDENLRNKLFEDYLLTITRYNNILYVESHFTPEEWDKGWGNVNNNIPVSTSTGGLIAASPVSVTKFEKRIKVLDNECVDLHLKKQLPNEFYTHYISDTKIYKKLSLVKLKMDDFYNTKTTNNPNEYAVSFAKKVISVLDNLSLPELKNHILKDFVNDEENIFLVIKTMLSGGSNSLSNDEVLKDFRDLKTFADNYIDEYLKSNNSEKSNFLISNKGSVVTLNNEKNPFPLIFTGDDDKTFKLFDAFRKRHIIDKYIDFSFIFQQMKFKGHVSDIKHLKFMEWLNEQNYITEHEYADFKIEKSFRSLKKCANGTRVDLYIKLEEEIIKSCSD